VGVWLIVLVAGFPWIVGIAYCWSRRVRDDAVQPSMGELARKRLGL
jgi:hypothetical protein